MSDDVVIKEKEKSETDQTIGAAKELAVVKDKLGAKIQSLSRMEKISPFIRFHVSFFCPNTSHTQFVLIPRLGDETVIHLKYIREFS